MIATLVQIVPARRHRFIPGRGEMRSICLTLAAVGAVLASGSAHAQTYDPDYPVCIQIYGPVGCLDCSYGTLDQCKLLAVGRSESCVVNPYFAPKRPAVSRRSRLLKVVAGPIIL